MPDRAFSLCVYCGARPGQDPIHRATARAIGAAIGRRGWQLVYGGGHSGLMGELADAALSSGAHVVGIIPHRLIERELGHGGVHELIKVDTMHQRKQLMADRADAFLTLPGGVGTLEELFETWTWLQLGYHAKPIGLLNVAGYFDPLLDFMQRTVDQGFLSPEQMSTLSVDTDGERLLEALQARSKAVVRTADYSAV